MNAYGDVMQSGGLLDRGHVGLVAPRDQIIQKGLKLRVDLVPRNAEVQFTLSARAGPDPDFAEHLLVQLVDPVQRERSLSARRLFTAVEQRNRDARGFGWGGFARFAQSGGRSDGSLIGRGVQGVAGLGAIQSGVDLGGVALGQFEANESAA